MERDGQVCGKRPGRGRPDHDRKAAPLVLETAEPKEPTAPEPEPEPVIDVKSCPTCGQPLKFIEKYQEEAKRKLDKKYSEQAFWKWWKEQPTNVKADVLKAICAEESGIFKVEKVYEENCIGCGGTGQVEFMSLGSGGGGKFGYACSVCRGTGRFYGISYR